APFHDADGEDAGAVYVLRGPLRGDLDLGDAAHAKLIGEAPGDQAGTSLGPQSPLVLSRPARQQRSSSKDENALRRPLAPWPE
ncbi:MAG: hypothetical protein IT459_12420, partial [Planctomycetes bacterium]|nr:hypothetical protein [Planctomycetota bacterium]